MLSKRGKWTNEEVIEEFQKLVKANEDISAKNISTIRNDLYNQISRKFGGYLNFVESQGLGNVAIQQKWNADKVKTDLISRYENGLGISGKVLGRENNPLNKAARRYFGNLENAITSCGIDYDTIREFTFWNEDLVKSEFLKLYNDGNITKVEQIRESNRGLDHAIRKLYGSYDNLCNALGLDVTKIRAYEYETSKENLIEALIKLRDEGYPLNISSVKQVFPNVRVASNKYFGNYSNALEYIGVDINNHINDRVFTSYAGREFEKTVAEMFDALDKKYQYQYRGFNGIIPDFYDEEKDTIIDAKLSSWSVFNCETLEKYLPNCERLVVLYLRGKHIEVNDEKVEMRAITHYYELLKEKGLTSFIDKFERIKSELHAESSESTVA